VYQAYLNRNYDFVEKYFALKEIYEQGGIYLDNRIIIDAPFNFVRYFDVFFCYADNSNFTDWTFGGHAGNVVLEKILMTYDEVGFYDDIFENLAKRIKNILTIDYEMPINGVNSFFAQNIALFAKEVTVLPKYDDLLFGCEVHFCHHNYSGEVTSEEYITIKKQALKDMMELTKTQSALRENKIKQLEKRGVAYATLKKDYDKLRQTNKSDEQKVAFEKIKNTLNEQVKRLSAEQDRISHENDRISTENKNLFIECHDLKNNNYMLTENNKLLNDKVEWTVEERTRLTSENDRISKEIKKYVEQIRKSEEQISALTLEQKQLQEYLEAMHNSTSWKVTGWIRRIGGILRK
jgi:hypothetical protein